MGRPQKIYPSQVDDILNGNNDPITINAIAKILETTQATIRKKIRQLRKDGRPILPTRRGVILKEKVKNIDDAKQIEESARWQISILLSLSGIASFTKILLLESQKFLVSKESRKELRHMAILLRQQVDLAETDEALGPLQLGA